ncbi:MAG TPA: response regulator [Nocardioides sp.]
MHALIIDDSRAMRTILRRTVAALGFATTEAGDGRAALDHLEAGLRPDVCLIDWNMPVMDGYTFVTRVRANPEWRDVTLMMVTTESQHSQIVRALAAGAHEYVIKPFTADAIEDKLRLLGLVRDLPDATRAEVPA